jgi:hypothetical protein
MFIEKVAYITQVDVPEEFWDKVEATVYHDDSDGAYFEIDAKQTKALREFDILTDEEVKDIIYEEVAYIMMYVPA